MSAGIHILPGTTGKCIGNLISGNIVDFASGANGNGIFIDTPCTINLVTNNILKSNSQIAIRNDGGSTNLLLNNLGFNPQGWATTTPSVPASGTAQTNTNGYPVIVTIGNTGMGISAVSIVDPAGTTNTFTGTISIGFNFQVSPGGKITLTYTGAPAWQWYGL